MPASLTPPDARTIRRTGFLYGHVSPRAVRRLAVATTALLLAAGSLLAVRRYLGALDVDMPRPALVTTALFLGAVVAALRVMWRRMFPAPESRTGRTLDQFVGWGGSAALITTAVACCYPGLRNSDWLIWLPLVIADQFWRQTYFDNGVPGRALEEIVENDASPTHVLPSNATAPQAATTHSGAHGGEAASSLGRLDDNQAFGEQNAGSHGRRADASGRLVQQLFRVRLENGDEAIYGTLRADFQASQRHATLHVGFCPPLCRRPEIEVDACGREEAKIKVVQALAHGVRLDVRLAAPATSPRALQIDMAAIPCAVANSCSETAAEGDAA